MRSANKLYLQGHITGASFLALSQHQIQRRQVKLTQGDSGQLNETGQGYSIPLLTKKRRRLNYKMAFFMDTKQANYKWIEIRSRRS